MRGSGRGRPDLEAHRREVTDAFTALTEADAGRMASRLGSAARNFQCASLALVGATNELVIEWVVGHPQPSIEQLSTS